jgi:hypothetical protein
MRLRNRPSHRSATTPAEAPARGLPGRPRRGENCEYDAAAARNWPGTVREQGGHRGFATFRDIPFNALHNAVTLAVV